MLRTLHISNYVLIDSLDVNFPEGLVIITGQTGAGKSILLGALSLLTGAKADASVISSGAETCVVEAEFDTSDPLVRTAVEAEDIEWEDGHLLIRRVVYATGRSRSFVNDSPVNLKLLSEISSRLIDIHSQHQNLLLEQGSFQLSLLDDFASCKELRSEISKIWAEWKEIQSSLEENRRSLSELDSQRAYNDSCWAELDKASLVDGEQEELEAEQLKISQSADLKQALASALSLIDPQDDEHEGVASSLRQAQRSLEKTVSLLPESSELAGRLESSRIEIEDIIDGVQTLYSSLDFSEERMQRVESRLSLLYSLECKHNVASVAELIAVREDFAGKLFNSTALEERIEELQAKSDELNARYDALAEELHAKRLAAAGPLAAELQGLVRALELDKAVFEVEIRPCAPGRYGADEVEYRFSSTGSLTAPLSKCASGGELSRIMLSLKAMMARYEGMPTMIFDEIDTGVSGSAAHKMGRLICDMGNNMQVFAITHLPQVAAKGSAHYVVEKSEAADGRTLSSIREVKGGDRVMEIARLLSGETLTAEAVANAEVLLKS